MSESFGPRDDVVRVDRSKLYTLDELSNCKFRKQLMKKLAYQACIVSDIANMADFDCNSDENDSDDVCKSSPNKRAAAADLFGHGDDYEDFEAFEDDVKEHSYAVATTSTSAAQLKKVRRVDSLSLSSSKTSSSSKTTISRSRHMRAVLGYSDGDEDNTTQKVKGRAVAKLEHRGIGKQAASRMKHRGKKCVSDRDVLLPGAAPFVRFVGGVEA